MKKRLWKLAMILIVLGGLVGCQNATPADIPGTAITRYPDVKPTKEPEATATPEPTDTPIPNVEATKEPEATETQKPTDTPIPEVLPTKEPEVTAMPKPTNTPILEVLPTKEPEATATPELTKTPIGDEPVLEHTGVIIALPDDSANKWENEWADSETNISIDYFSGIIPKEGTVTLKLCYPKRVFSTRNETFEIEINHQSTLFHMSEVSKRGNLNEDWNYVEVSAEYPANAEKLSILLKTHSSAGSRGTLFAVADVVITELSSDKKQYVDLTKENVEIVCKKGNFFEGSLLECSYRISDMLENKVLYEAGDLNKEVPEVSAKYEQDSKLYCLTYRLPETDTKWEDPWYDSEANIIFRYGSEIPLSNGTIYASVCIPKGNIGDREDSFELAVHGVTDFYNYRSDGVKVTYLDGGLYADNRQVLEEEGCYKIKFEVEYDNSKVGYGNELLFYFKSHCSEVIGAYEVTICDVVVEDKTAGSFALDLSSSNLWVDGKMYRTGKTVDFTLSDSIFDFYIVNEIRKIAEGASHALEVYNSDDTTVIFQSSDSSIASVDSNGKVNAHKKGSCEITVTKESTGESKSFMLTVSDPQVVLTNYEVLMLVGSEAEWEARTEYAMNVGSYTFRSADTEVASVDATGLVKAKQEGTTKIIVTDTVNQVDCSVELVVYKPKDTDGIAQYLSIKNTEYVTADIAKRSYQLLYDVYKNVFDYFNYGEYEDVTLFFTVNDYSPAYSDSRDVYLASEHMLANAKDVDCITHELIHCAQNHISVGDYVWLMEGLTDYGRYLFGLHNEDCGWSLPEYDATQHYTNSYGVTAAFIKFVTENYCEDMPHIINKMFKEPSGYDDSIWKTNTGYSIDELWELYSKS